MVYIDNMVYIDYMVYMDSMDYIYYISYMDYMDYTHGICRLQNLLKLQPRVFDVLI